MRGTRSHFASDEGMTLIEVVIASAMLFFIMTALLGLIGRTTMMSAQAEQMNNVNNAINSYVEWARSLPFDKVALTSAGGSMETTTLAAGNYTVQIVPNVQDNSNAKLKNLWLGVTTTTPNGFIRVVNTMVIIHDRDQYMTQSSTGALTDPVIVFLAASPPNGTPVWVDPGTGASLWKDASNFNRPLNLSVKATATEGRTVTEVYIQGEQLWDLQDAYGNFARWPTPTWTDSPIFSWDLRQKDALNNPAVQEGVRSIWAFVTDSNGVTRHDIRQYCVDNYAPSKVPWPLTHNGGGSMSGAITWPVVPDGTDNAYGYLIDMRKQTLAPAASYGLWTPVPGYMGPDTSYPVVGVPMSRYAARVRAYGPRGLLYTGTSWSPWLNFVTRPLLSGNYAIDRQSSSNKWWKVTATLSTTAPSFESTATSYAWYEDGVLLSTTTSPSFVAPTVTALGDPGVTPFPARSYSVAVTTTPIGLPLGLGMTNPPVTMTSNLVTTVTAGTSGTYTFGGGTW